MHKLCTCAGFAMLFFKETKQISTIMVLKFLAQVFPDIFGRSVRSLHYMRDGDYEFRWAPQYLFSQAGNAN